MLVLVCSSAPVSGSYTPLPQSLSLPEAASTFAADFGRWNAGHDGMFLHLLQATPASQRGEILMRLFWLWLLNPWGDTVHGAPTSASPVDWLPRATIVGHPLGDPPSLPLNGGEDLPGTVPPSESGLSQGDPLPLDSTSSNGPVLVGDPLETLPTSEEASQLSDSVAAPEPATLLLLGTGGIALLIVRRRRLTSNSLA
jgi:hypothetical protein